jgi:hypothetical protein
MWLERCCLAECPYTDRASQGPDFLFPEVDVEVILGILERWAHAQPAEVG